MYPVLFTIGSLTITSFGLFLLFGILVGLFVIWRLATLYDLNHEKVIDLFLITLFSSLAGARLVFALNHFQLFSNPFALIAINSLPGLNLWGGVIGGGVALAIFSRRFKLPWWQVTDFAIVALLVGLVFGNIGCFLGSCQYGPSTNMFFGINQIGVVGKRFPLQIVGLVVYYLAFISIWKKSLRFHISGTVATSGLMWICFIQFMIDFIRADMPDVFGPFKLGQPFEVVIFVAAAVVYYRLAKRSVAADLAQSRMVITSSSRRQEAISRWQKRCYTWLIDRWSQVVNIRKLVSRKLNVRSNPKKF